MLAKLYVFEKNYEPISDHTNFRQSIVLNVTRHMLIFLGGKCQHTMMTNCQKKKIKEKKWGRRHSIDWFRDTKSTQDPGCAGEGEAKWDYSSPFTGKRNSQREREKKSPFQNCLGIQKYLPMGQVTDKNK